MAQEKGDRASRRRKNIIIAKARRKLARIRDIAAREGRKPETTTIHYKGEVIGTCSDLKENDA